MRRLKIFTEEEIDAISQSDTDDIVVYTEYYAVLDEENSAINEDELILLESDEVNELIKEHYYNKESINALVGNIEDLLGGI